MAWLYEQLSAMCDQSEIPMPPDTNGERNSVPSTTARDNKELSELIENSAKICCQINRNRPAVLFIDEAYAPAPPHQDYAQDFGQEAIDTILKAMEDYRSDFVVIIAGYDGLMHRFINSNPGLKSRFNKYIYYDG